MLGQHTRPQGIPRKAAAQSEIHHRQTAVGCIHCGNDIEVGGKRVVFCAVHVDFEFRGLTAPCPQVAAAGFEKVEYRAEYIRQVRPIDFIDDEQHLFRRVLRGVSYGLREDSVFQFKPG